MDNLKAASAAMPNVTGSMVLKHVAHVEFLRILYLQSKVDHIMEKGFDDCFHELT